MEKVVSVSLGSPSRDFMIDLELLGRSLRLHRRGVGSGFYEDYFQMLRELDADPEVCAIGLGGINRYLFTGGGRSEFRMARKMVGMVRRKPVVDGSGLKMSLEPHVIHWLQNEGTVDFPQSRVLMVAATDRWGMASALNKYAGEIVFGDLMFGLDINYPIRSWETLCKLASLIVPIATHVIPFEWLYPTGEAKVEPKFLEHYAWADVIAGDWKFIHHHMPEGRDVLAGKTIITNTLTLKDVDELRARGLRTLVTTTPSLSGRSFGTNVIEAVVVALAGQRPETMTPDDYLAVLHQLEWDRPYVARLQE